MSKQKQPLIPLIGSKVFIPLPCYAGKIYAKGTVKRIRVEVEWSYETSDTPKFTTLVSPSVIKYSDKGLIRW